MSLRSETLPEQPTLADLDNPAFDVFEAERVVNTGEGDDADDPYPLFHKMHAQGTVHKGGYRQLFTDVPDSLHDQNQYMAFGYETVMKVLTEPETFANAGAYMHTLGRSFGRTITVMDAPEHVQYRRIFQKAFLPQVVIKWGDTVVEPVVERLMSRFIQRGKADLVGEFTHHYPFQVIYGQLGLDAKQAPIFHKLAVAQSLTRVNMPEGFDASQKLGRFFQSLIEERRARPVDNDLVTQLATVEADGERLPDEVIISFLRQLMNAGGDTTYRGTSNLLVGLLTNPDQLAAVAANPALLSQAIEEALRWEGPVHTVPRYVARDTVLDGVPLPQGAILNVMLGSANRDPAHFENPDAFDIFRPRSVRPLAFGSGPHVCIGQHLAKVEMTRALTALLAHLPNLRLDPEEPAPKIRGFRLRVPDHIHVLFDRPH